MSTLTLMEFSVRRMSIKGRVVTVALLVIVTHVFSESICVVIQRRNRGPFVDPHDVLALVVY